MKKWILILLAVLAAQAAFAQEPPKPYRKGIDWEKQRTHTEGAPEYIPGSSVLTYPRPLQLLREFSGTGRAINNVPLRQPGSTEVVDTGFTVGQYIKKDPATGQFLKPVPTTWIKIHYAANGAHIVPAPPEQ